MYREPVFGRFGAADASCLGTDDWATNGSAVLVGAVQILQWHAEQHRTAVAVDYDGIVLAFGEWQ